MARNSEVTRQWQVLRDIDAARTGITIGKLASARGVHQRTIRRDIEALAQAGFPLYDEKINGTAMWKLRAKPFRSLEDAGLSVIELCALYFSRTLLGTLAGAAFQDDADRAMAKIERALPASCRRFLDRLPVALKATVSGRKKQDEKKVREFVTRATEALMNQRRLAMRYESASSQRARDYVIEPLRISYCGGGVYLTACVEAYGEIRNFAFERIRTLGVLDERFEPRPLPVEPFAHSLGAYSGTPERIEIEFDAAVADYVAGREWHPSQTFERREHGSLLMRLDVCVDPPLRSWILGFAAAARVVAPLRLAQEILESLEDARERYMPRLELQMARIAPAPERGEDSQHVLPMTSFWRAS